MYLIIELKNSCIIIIYINEKYQLFIEYKDFTS